MKQTATNREEFREELYFEIPILLIAVTFSLYYLWSIWGMPWEASLLGIILTILIITFALARGISILFDFRKRNRSEPKQSFRELTKYSYSALLLMSTLIYLFVIQFLGYWITTFLFLIISFRFLGTRNPKHLLIVSLGITISAYLLFGQFLKVRFPRGLLF